LESRTKISHAGLAALLDLGRRGSSSTPRRIRRPGIGPRLSRE
jgi:hypothetical protein